MVLGQPGQVTGQTVLFPEAPWLHPYAKSSFPQHHGLGRDEPSQRDVLEGLAFCCSWGSSTLQGHMRDPHQESRVQESVLSCRSFGLIFLKNLPSVIIPHVTNVSSVSRWSFITITVITWIYSHIMKKFITFLSSIPGHWELEGKVQAVALRINPINPWYHWCDTVKLKKRIAYVKHEKMNKK